MKLIVLAAASSLGLLMLSPTAAHAYTCANGVYRAGCVGPNGAVGVRKYPYYRGGYYHRYPYYRPPYAGGGCAAGPYRAGCAGPRGGFVVRRPY